MIRLPQQFDGWLSCSHLYKWLLNIPTFLDKPWQTHTHIHTYIHFDSTFEYRTRKGSTGISTFVGKPLRLRDKFGIHRIHPLPFFDIHLPTAGFMSDLVSWFRPPQKQSSKSDALLGENARWFSQLQAFMAMLLCSGIFHVLISDGKWWVFRNFPSLCHYATNCWLHPGPFSGLNALHPRSFLCNDLGTASGHVGSCRAPGCPRGTGDGAMSHGSVVLELDEIMKRLPVPAVWSPRYVWLRTRTPDSLRMEIKCNGKLNSQQWDCSCHVGE
jgi:hypothetical protein